MRLFYKKTNPAFARLNSLTEEELIKEAKKDIEKSLGITSNPKSYEVTKWDNAMPVYSLDHKQAVEALTQNLADLYPNVYLAGCSYFGVGIAACMANGEEIAVKLLNSIE